MNTNNKKLSNQTEFLFLILYIILFIVFSYFLVADYTYRTSILKLLASISWIGFCTFQILIRWRKLTIEKIEDESTENEGQRAGQKKSNLKWFSEIVAIFVLCIPLAVILLIASLYKDLANVQLVNKLEFEYLQSLASIFIVMGLTIQDLEKLFEFEKEVTKRILTLFSLLFFGFGFILYLIYVINLTEVSS